jgi:RHS repeat-associated protein
MSIGAALLASFALNAQATDVLLQPDDTLPGFKSNQVHVMGPIDNVGVFSGDPGIAVQLGPTYPLSMGLSWGLKAFYSSKLWNMTQRDDCGDEPSVSFGLLRGYPVLGVGWTLDLGHIQSVYSGSDPEAKTMYFSPDGGRHEIRAGLTDDGSRLRVVTLVGGAGFRVDYPDGSQHFLTRRYQKPLSETGNYLDDWDFTDEGILPGEHYGLEYINDRFGNEVLRVEAVEGKPFQPRYIYLKDGATGSERGRIIFNWETRTLSGNIVWPYLASIQFPAFGGGTLTAAFSSQWRSISRPAFHTAEGLLQTSGCWVSNSAYGPYLDSITQTGTGLAAPQLYSFLYSYESDAAQGWWAGTLRSVTTPSRAVVAYRYGGLHPCKDQNADIDTACGVQSGTQPTVPGTPSARPGAHRYWDSSPYVTRRTETEPYSGVTSETEYTRSEYAFTDPNDIQKVIEDAISRLVFVTRPSGNGAGKLTTRHIFHVDGGLNRGGSGIELVRSWYPSADASAAPIRKMIACYAQSGGAPKCGYSFTSPIEWTFDGDVRQQRAVTWYGAPGSDPKTCPATASSGVAPCSQVDRSGWHLTAMNYLTSTTSSTLYSPTGFRSRTTTTNWTPRVTATTWLLDLFDTQTISDDAVTATGPTSVVKTFAFSSSNGLLESVTQAHAEPGEVQSQVQSSFIATLTSGEPTRIASTITGAGPIPQGGTVPRLIGQFSRTRDYKHGLLWKSSWPTASTFDVTRDAVTGQIWKSRDAAGRETTFGYDALGRLTSIIPPGAPQIHATGISYSDPTVEPTTVVKVIRGTENSSDSTWERYHYDGLGRLVRETRRMADEVPAGQQNPAAEYATRQHEYNAAGLEWRTSEWKTCLDAAADCLVANTIGTVRQGFDPFGRPTRVTPADHAPPGKLTEVSISYADSPPAGAVQYTAIAHSDSADTTSGYVDGALSSTTRRRDPLGRLVRVDEPAIVGQGNLTTYAYNVHDKLAGVTQGGQSRSFGYDAFGFLRSETHPENGLTTYDSYDPLGNVLQRTEGSSTSKAVLTYEYDAGTRLKLVKAGTNAYAQNVYDGAADSALGCPASSNATGLLTCRVGTNRALASNPKVKEAFEYDAATGWLARQTTSFSSDAGLSPSMTGSPTFVQSWQYNALGLVARHLYPRESGGVFAVSTAYSYGLPVSVRANGFRVVSNVRYHPWGGLEQYTTGLGIPSGVSALSRDVTTATGIGLDLIPRPTSITTTGATPPYSSGAYAYDGSGNIVGIGVDEFDYDARGRLLEARYNGSPQAYAYDGFGNLRTKGSLSLDPDPVTNRVTASGALYDTRGNLTKFGIEGFTFDALNRIAVYQSPAPPLNPTVTWRYVHSAANERIVRLPSAGPYTYTLRDQQNRLVSEYEGAPTRDNIYLGNLLVGSLRAGEGWRFYSSDHLGSTRLSTTIYGTGEALKYWPFGEEIPSTTSSQRTRFAAMERDTESAQYYDHARSHGFQVGRFLSIDRVLGRQMDPQTWNRYTYAGNNPIRLVDTDGNVVQLAPGLRKSDAKYLRAALAEMVRRPSGRAVFQTMVNAKETVVIGVKTLNEDKEIIAARTKSGPVDLTFGTTTAVHPVTNTITMNVDRGAIQEFAPRTGGTVSADGVITTAHEFDHGRTALLKDDAKLRAGDETGSSQAFGEAVFKEGKDMSSDAAKSIVDTALAPPTCNRADGPCPQ